MNKIKDILTIGSEKFFEYHCFESHKSSDAQIWYHSHQECIVIEVNEYEKDSAETKLERLKEGTPISYKVKFHDNFIADVFEDELLDTETEYTRPDPPEDPSKKT